MKEGRRLVEKTTGEDYLHKDVWRVVQRQIKYAEAHPEGALYDDLIAMVFAFHAIEGYSNFIGEKIAPELWKDEKTQFRGDGLTGKLKAICERCGLPAPDHGKRPYGTISELKTLRDAATHPKTRKTDEVVEYDERSPPPLFRKPYLSKLVDHNKALRARDDIKSIADQIHAAARAKFPKVDIGLSALDGYMSMHVSSITVAP